MKNLASLVLLLLSVSLSARAQTIDLAALSAPLESLRPGEKQILDEAIQLTQRGDHGLALASLAQLTASNPKNSAYRVLKAYTLLQLGNLVGALNESRAAESSKPPSPYRCWFLAQVTYLVGNTAHCEREIRHIAAHPITDRRPRSSARISKHSAAKSRS